MDHGGKGRKSHARDYYNLYSGKSVSSAQASSNNSSSTATTTTSTSASFDNFLFIGDSRYHGIETGLKALGNNVSVCAVDSSNASQWVPVTQNKSGTVLSTNITLPATASGVSVMLGVNNTSQINELKQVLNNLHTNYPNVKIYYSSIYHVGSSYKNGNLDASTMNANIDSMNEQIKTYASSTDWLEYVDVTNGLHDENGYLKNGDSAGLHLQGEGQTQLVNNIKSAISGQGSNYSQDTADVVHNSASPYMLVIASYTTQNTQTVESYQYAYTNMISTVSGTSGQTTQHSPTPSDAVVEDITTVRYTSTSLDYQAVLKDYTLYFDFLWAVYISSKDKDTTLWLAEQALNSNIVITLYGDKKVSVNTSQVAGEDIMRSVMEGTTAFIDYFHTTRTTTTTTTVLTSKACVTEADVWFLKYSNIAETYDEYKSKSKEVVEEKTNDSDELMKFLREEDRAYNLDESTYLVERMIEENAQVAHLLDIYKYIISCARKAESGYSGIDEIINVGSFDISTFVPVNRGYGEGALGGTEIPEPGDGYNNVFKVGTRTYKNYKQGQGSWAFDDLAGFPGDNLANSGCAITSIAVILSGYGIDMSPRDVNNYAASNAPYESCHGVTLTNLLGKTVTYHNSGNFKEMIIEQLKAGKPCMARTSAYSTSHYICILAISDDGTQVYVSDVAQEFVGQDRDGWQPISFLDRINMEIYTIDD